MFGKRLRESRIKAHHTQQHMADFLDASLNTYQKYEQSERNPSFDVVVKLADYLDVSIDWLLGRDEWLKSHGVSFD